MKAWWVLGGSLALAFNTAAASFDCAKAVSPNEKLICSDQQLSELDAQLQLTYRRVLGSSRRPEAIKSEQRAWLGTERRRCNDVACLKHAYQRRLTALSTALDTARHTVARGAPEPAYSLARAPFVSPLIVKDLTTWLSDRGQQVVAINVSDSQGSNRYFGEIQTRKLDSDRSYVYVRSQGTAPDAAESEFGYQHLGRTTSGVDVLLTMDSEGGSGVFTALLLVKLEYEASGLSSEADQGKPPAQTLRFNQKRLLIKSLGAVPLGDRWAGQLKVTGNDISIGKNVNTSAGTLEASERIIHVEYVP